MEDTLLLKGVALLSALIGVQQWIALEVSIADIFFLVTVTAFLITLERDYVSAKDKKQTESPKKDSPRLNFDSSRAIVGA